MIAQLDIEYLKTRPGRIWARLVSYFLFEGRPLTTKGRWVNPIILLFHGILKRIPCPVNVKKPIFIVGTGRSGTTILGKVLSMHPDIGFLNEPKAIWHSVHKKDDVLGNYPNSYGKYRLLNDASKKMRLSAHRLYGYFQLFSGSNRILDKYPEMVFRIPFIRSIFPNAKFIFLVRNGWDTCYSIERWCEKHSYERNGSMEDWWGLDNRKWHTILNELVENDTDLCKNKDKICKLTSNFDKSVVEWILTMREGIINIKKEEIDILLVKFEELGAHPRQCIKNIIDFVELPIDTKLLDYAERTLKPVSPYPRGNIQPYLEKIFHKTLKILGYF